jgi:hypothetical protein
VPAALSWVHEDLSKVVDRFEEYGLQSVQELSYVKSKASVPEAN